MKRTAQGAWRPQVTALLIFFSAAVLSVPEDAASKPQIEVVPVTQHGDGVEKLWLSDDERIVVTVGQDETIKIWDYASGRLIRTLDTTALGIAHGAFALMDVVPSLHYMVAVHQDGSLKVWDLETGGLVRVLAHNLRKVESVAITEDGTGVVTAQDNEPLKLWDMQDGKLKRTFGEHATRWTEVFPNGDSIFVFSGDDPVIKQWSLSTGRQILSLSVGKETPSDLAKTPDGRRLVCRAGNTLKIWDLASGRLVKIIEKVGSGTGGAPHLLACR
jgi:WD40 repeat protein